MSYNQIVNLAQDINSQALGSSIRTPQNEMQKSSMRDFVVEKQIGDGAYSKVFLVTRKSDNIEYALKQVKINQLSDREKFNALNEVRILASVEDRNVVSFKEAFFDEASSTLCIVMDYADGGDLYNKILHHKKNQTFFSEHEIMDCFVQMTRGLRALHEKHILHRDLKSANVFLEIDGAVKLGDLNVSKILKKDGLLFTQTGTPYYASPEVWRDEPYDQKSDIWSLGCVLYEMITLNPPFTASNMDKLFQVVSSGNYAPIPQHYTRNLDRILKQLLQVQPTKRPSCDQLLNMTVVQDFINKNSGDPTQIECEDQKKALNNDMLKTIHIPHNLSQLSTLLPKAKYESNESYENTLRHPFDRGSIISMAQQIVLPPIREFESRQIQSIDPLLQQRRTAQLTNREYEERLKAHDEKPKQIIRSLKNKVRQHQSVEMRDRDFTTRMSTCAGKPSDEDLTQLNSDAQQRQRRRKKESTVIVPPQTGSQPRTTQQDSLKTANALQVNRDILPDLQASLQAIRSAKDLINQQLKLHNQQQSLIPRTNSMMSQNLGLDVIREKFASQHASANGLLTQKQSSTSRNTQSQQIETSGKKDPAAPVLITKESRQNILQKLPCYETQRRSTDSSLQPLCDKSKIIVNLTTTVQQTALQTLKSKPPIGEKSPKKRNVVGVKAATGASNLPQPSPGQLRHSESHKLIPVTSANNPDQELGCSSQLLPSIRRQNGESKLSTTQTENNRENLEQLRYYAAIRQLKHQRKTHNSVASSRMLRNSSCGEKQPKSRRLRQQYQSFER